MTLTKQIALIVFMACSFGSFANSGAISKADTLEVKIGYDSSFVNCEYVFDFKDSSILISSTDSIISWEWDFGDGSDHLRIPYPTHKYNTYGSFTVKLVVMLTNGVKDSTTRMIYLQGPYADFTFSEPYQDLDTITICQWQELSIRNTSTGDLIDQDYDDVWWGDGEVTTPGMSWGITKHTYRYSGTFMLTLRIYAQMPGTNMTCMSSYPHYDENRRTRIQKVVVVQEAPRVGLEVGTTPTYRYHPTGFKPIFDSTFNAERMLYYGDGDSSRVMNDDSLLIHKYQISNTYDIQFIATYETKDQEQRNCADTFSAQILVLHDSLNSIYTPGIEFDAYPVPSTGHLNIACSKGIKSIEVLDELGSIVMREDLTSVPQHARIHLEALHHGAYILQVITPDGTIVHKRIVVE